MDKSRQRKKPEDRKKEIIDIALQLFLTAGFEKVTMSEIAAASGVAKGLCYHYFPSKEDLYHDALSNFVNDLTSEYLAIIKNKQLTLEERMAEMELVLKNHQGKSLFYDFSRQQGNKQVYSDILYRTFNNLIPDLTSEFLLYANIPSQFEGRVRTLMSFILFGQMGILTEKDIHFTKQLNQIRPYISLLLNAEIESLGEEK